MSEWHRDVSEATERQGYTQRLRLSRLTKGSCNCFSRATDCTVAVNVTGYNGRSFSDTELRGQRSAGASESGSAWFNRGGEVSSFTGAVWSQLRFPVAFAPLCQLPESARTKWLLQQLSETAAAYRSVFAWGELFCLLSGACKSKLWPLMYFWWPLMTNTVTERDEKFTDDSLSAVSMTYVTGFRKEKYEQLIMEGKKGL